MDQLFELTEKKLEYINPNDLTQSVKGLSEAVQMLDLFHVITENSMRRLLYESQVQAWRMVSTLTVPSWRTLADSSVLVSCGRYYHCLHHHRLSYRTTTQWSQSQVGTLQPLHVVSNDPWSRSNLVDAVRAVLTYHKLRGDASQEQLPQLEVEAAKKELDYILLCYFLAQGKSLCYAFRLFVADLTRLLRSYWRSTSISRDLVPDSFRRPEEELQSRGVG